jgi:hypothetical protein
VAEPDNRAPCRRAARAVHAGVRPGALVLAAALTAGCTAAAVPAPPVRMPLRPALVTPAAGSLVRVPRADYGSPESVAAAFYTAWGSLDSVHDGPDAYLARCAPLVTATLARQMAASQPTPAAWQQMRSAREVSLVTVTAVTYPDGAPAATASRVYLRVYARRVTRTASGQVTGSDGVTVELTRTGGRWLVSAVLFY